MVRGLSARKSEQHTRDFGNKVPRSTLKDLWLKFFKCPANTKFKFGVQQQTQMLQKLKDEFEFPSQGRLKYFMPDEEDMIIHTIELAQDRGFPYDVDNLLALTTTMLQDVPQYKGQTVERGWLSGFERRYAGRIKLVKTGSLDQTCVNKATEEVSDECIRRFVEMIEELKVCLSVCQLNKFCLSVVCLCVCVR